MPLGPSVLLTRSPTAMAPTKAERRAFSPFSWVVPSSKICVGLKEAFGHVSGMVTRGGSPRPEGHTILQRQVVVGYVLSGCRVESLEAMWGPRDISTRMEMEVSGFFAALEGKLPAQNGDYPRMCRRLLVLVPSAAVL